jgi:hypothetical protein
MLGIGDGGLPPGAPGDAKQEVVAYLWSAHQVSLRRACGVLSTDRSLIR